MKMTNDERQALIIALKMLEPEIKGIPIPALTKAIEIALEALTAEPEHHNGMMHLSHELAAARKQLAELAKQEPVAWRNPKTGNICLPRNKKRGLESSYAEEYEQYCEPVFTRAAPPAPVVPDGWEACSPEWIDRNGPCSCANAPRLAFGSVGQHYHPHIFIDNTAQQYESLAGWRMVPIKPTEEMVDALEPGPSWSRGKIKGRYANMLEAAPKPEA